jgi:single-stranded DNA-binding protein
VVSADLNLALLTGVLADDPRPLRLRSGVPAYVLRLDVNSRCLDLLTGRSSPAFRRFEVLTSGRVAEACARLLREQASIAVEGQLLTHVWRDAYGSHRWTGVAATRLFFLRLTERTVPSAP